MAYDKSTDLTSIQADVLTTSLEANAKIKKLNQLKTTQKSITKAINELKGNLSQAINKSQTASDQVTDVKENIINIVKEQVTSIVSGGIQNDEFKCQDGDTKFLLTKTPADKDNIMFFVNGVKYARADHSYNESTNEETWIGIKDQNHPNGFVLSSKDIVSVVYMAKN